MSVLNFKPIHQVDDEKFHRISVKFKLSEVSPAGGATEKQKKDQQSRAQN